MGTKRFVLAGGGVFLATFLLWRVPLEAADDKDGHRLPSALTIHQGYMLNRDAFPFLTCRFKIVETEAKSVEAGLRGEYSEPTRVHEGYWVRDGLKDRLRVACDPAILARRREGDLSVPLSIVTDDYLSDGKHAVRGAQDIGIANFSPPGGRGLRPRDRPFSWFGKNFDQRLEMLLADPSSAKVNDWVKHEGRDLVSLTYLNTGPDAPVETIYFDPNRGYLPVVQLTTTKHLNIFNYIVSVKALPGERWFPEKWVFIQHFPLVKQFRVRTLEVTSLDVKNRPPDSAFDFPLAEYYQLVDPYRPDSGYHPEPTDRIEVGKMRAIADRLDAEVVSNAKPPPSEEAVPPPLARRRWLTVNAAIALFLILGGLALILWKRRRPRSAE